MTDKVIIRRTCSAVCLQMCICAFVRSIERQNQAIKLDDKHEQAVSSFLFSGWNEIIKMKRDKLGSGR